MKWFLKLFFKGLRKIGMQSIIQEKLLRKYVVVENYFAI